MHLAARQQTAQVAYMHLLFLIQYHKLKKHIIFIKKMSISDLLVPNNYTLYGANLTLPVTVSGVATYTGTPGGTVNFTLLFQRVGRLVQLTIIGNITTAPTTPGYYIIPAGSVPSQFLPTQTGTYWYYYGSVVNGTTSATPGTEVVPGIFIINPNGSINIYPTSAGTNFNNTGVIGFYRNVIIYIQ